MGLVNIDTETLAKTLIVEAAKVLPGILDGFTKDLGSELRTTLKNRKITIAITIDLADNPTPEA
jgi:hypothetical protein